jgi:DNA-binding CsgD family transcriptional regulator
VPETPHSEPILRKSQSEKEKTPKEEEREEIVSAGKSDQEPLLQLPALVQEEALRMEHD